MRELLVSSGEHPCEWLIDGKLVAGDVDLEPMRWPGGAVYDRDGGWTELQSGGRSFDMGTARTFPLLRGVLRSNVDVVLLGARLVHLFPGQARLRGELALCGMGLPDEESPVFSGVRFQVAGLTELSGEAPFAGELTSRTQSSDGNWSLVVKENPDAAQEWTTDSGDSVSVHYVVRLHGGTRYQVSAHASPVVEVQGSARTAARWLEDYVRPTAEIAAFATAGTPSIAWAELVIEAEARRAAQVFGPGITQQPFEASPDSMTGRPPLLRLGSDGASLPDLLTRWRTLRRTYTTFFTYLTTGLSQDTTPRARFLALVPALESYHSVKHGRGPVPAANFRRQHRNVFRRLARISDIEREDLAWLRTWVSTLGTYDLAERLRQLHAGLPESLRLLVDARIDPLPGPLAGIMDSPADLWAVMGKVRNNLAHGGPEATPDQLVVLLRVAAILAEAVTLTELDLPHHVLESIIGEDRWSLI